MENSALKAALFMAISPMAAAAWRLGEDDCCPPRQLLRCLSFALKVAGSALATGSHVRFVQVAKGGERSRYVDKDVVVGVESEGFWGQQIIGKPLPMRTTWAMPVMASWGAVAPRVLRQWESKALGIQEPQG